MSRPSTPKTKKGSTPKFTSPIQSILNFSQNASVFVESINPLSPSSLYKQVHDEVVEIPEDLTIHPVEEVTPTETQQPIYNQTRIQTPPLVGNVPIRHPDDIVVLPPALPYAQVQAVPPTHISTHASHAAASSLANHPARKPRGKYFLGHGWVPFAGALVWFACIFSLLVIWLADGTPRYPWGPKTIAYISDVGAANKGLFISLAVLTAILFITTLSLDRALRLRSRLPGFMRRRENVFSILSITFGTIGVIALVLLSIFDDRNYDQIHWPCTAIFIICIFINAIFNSMEIGFLSHDYPLVHRLRSSAKLKIGAISIGLAFAITMAALMGSCSGGVDACNTIDSTAAVFEWSVAFVFVIYFATYIWDLRILDDPALNPGVNDPLPPNKDVELGTLAPPVAPVFPAVVEGTSAA